MGTADDDSVGEDTCCAMFHVSMDRCPESIFRTFHKVAASTTMHVDFYSTGDYIHTFDVNKFSSDNGQIAVVTSKILLSLISTEPSFIHPWGVSIRALINWVNIRVMS